MLFELDYAAVSIPVLIDASIDNVVKMSRFDSCDVFIFVMFFFVKRHESSKTVFS